MKTAIINGRVVTPSGVKENLEVMMKNGRITFSKEEAATEFVIKNGKLIEGKVKADKVKADKVIDAKGAYVLPGFFDTHMHGGGFFESSSGMYDLKKKQFNFSEKEFEKGYPIALKAHASHGTTSLIMSVASSAEPNLEMFMQTAGKLVNKYIGGSKLLGLDMEGTYIKDKAFGGAQNPEHFKEPEIRYFEKLNKLSGGNIKKVLVAPEWGDSATKFIKYLVKNGIAAGVGHSGATYAEMMKAYNNGVTYAVHFGNGPMSQNFKGGGVLDAMFELKDKIMIELICDLCHLNPKWVSAFMKNFNFNVAGVTDAMFFSACESKLTRFEFGGNGVEIKNGAAWLISKKNTLCGSCVTTDVEFSNFLNIIMSNQQGNLTGRLFDRPVSLDTGVSMASKIMSGNPAKLYGMEEIGSLEEGKKADVVLMDIKEKGGKYVCNANKVFIDGEAI